MAALELWEGLVGWPLVDAHGGSPTCPASGTGWEPHERIVRVGAPPAVYSIVLQPMDVPMDVKPVPYVDR